MNDDEWSVLLQEHPIMTWTIILVGLSVCAFAAYLIKKGSGL